MHKSDDLLIRIGTYSSKEPFLIPYGLSAKQVEDFVLALNTQRFILRAFSLHWSKRE